MTSAAGSPRGGLARLRAWWALDDDWVRPAPQIGAADIALAAGMDAAGLFFLELSRSLGVLEHTAAPRWVQWLAVTTGAMLLVARRRYPLSVGVLAAGHMFVVGVTMPTVMSQVSLQIVYFVALLSMVSWARSRRAALAVVSAIVLLMFLWVTWQLVLGSGAQDILRETRSLTVQGLFGPVTAAVLLSVAVNVIYFAGAVVGGQVSWRGARQKARLAEQAATIAEQADSLKARAVLDERLRIARELHDVVGHHVSVIGIQAGAARRVLTRDPEAASVALGHIESSSREAVSQMHALLGTLRDLEGTQPVAPGSIGVGSRSPEPGVGDLPALVAERGESALTVAYDLVESPPGAAATLTEPQSLSLYRVAQEALANVSRHSTALGIRERAASLNGAVDIGPRATGGYRVRMRIPVRSDDG